MREILKIARVFPRRTNMSPTDELAFFDAPPLMILPEIDEVHISVSFTYDTPRADWLAQQWLAVGVPVKWGGPALGDKTTEFIPGRYLKKGVIRTSVGCNNNCWFCKVHQREGGVRELPISVGYNIIDDNLLQCSELHIRKVFDMLARQSQAPVFSGGLEAKELKPWMAELLVESKPHAMYFAYDTPDDYEPLIQAGKMLRQAGYKTSRQSAACYVLIGYRGDTFEKAEQRLVATMDAGFMPFSMLYRDDRGRVDRDWVSFNTEWCNRIIVGSKFSKFMKQRRNSA